MWMKFFIESVATTTVLSPWCTRAGNASPRAVIPTSAANSVRTPSVRVDGDGLLSVADPQELRHRSTAIATSSSQPVSSSPARARSSRSRSTGTISARGRRLTKTTKRKPKRSSS